jgi:hypothetical protein
MEMEHERISASDEKKFLHDVSNPLAAAIFSIDLLNDELSGVAELDGSVPEMLTRIAGALQNIQALVEKRRAELQKKQGARQ